MKESEQDFSFALPQAPHLVRVDPDFTVLAKVDFQPPPAMLAVMLTNQTDVLGRLHAVSQLSGRKDKQTVARLERVLQHDPFHGVRLEASRRLRAIRTDDALAALLASTNQPDARVRRQVREDLGAFYRESVFAATLAALVEEKNPEIQAVLLRNLGAYPNPQTQEVLLRFLKSESYQNRLADAAIDAMRTQADPVSVPALLATLREREAAFTSGGFASGLSALARLARNDEDKDAVREFLVSHLNHRQRHVRRTAIAALGELGDPKAIAPLSALARGDQDNAERQAADQATAALRTGKKPAEDLRNLRAEVLSLQQQSRNLEKSLEELRKKVAELTQSKAASPEPDAKRKKK